MKFKAIVAVALLVAGCARQEPLPQWPAMEARASIAHMAQQQEKVQNVTGTGAVTLTRGNGQSVRLDSAVVAEFPQRVRLRAWKLGQAVFDMTLTPDGVWMLVADKSRREEILPAGASAAKFLGGWAMLHEDFYDDELVVVEETPATLIVRKAMAEGGAIEAEVDRATLTVRRHRVLDDTGEERFVLQYERYRLVNGIPFATRLRAGGEQGRIQVDLDEVQLNGELAPGAFVPPRRAEKLP